MSFIEALALVGTASTILGIFLTAYGIINNKTLKKESRLTREEIKAIREAIGEEVKVTRETVTKMIQETTKYLADLIVAQGGKVRTEIS